MMKHFTILKSIRQILTKSKDQEAEANGTVLGTILVLLSGIILYADKIINYFNLQITYDFKYYGSLEVFVWTVSGTVCSLILIATHIIKPYKWSLASPLTALSVQMMYTWRDEHWIQKDYFWWHTIAFIIFFAVLVYFINNYANTITALKSQVVRYKNIIREHFMFIGPETEEKGYIKEEFKKNYAKRRVELVNNALENE